MQPYNNGYLSRKFTEIGINRNGDKMRTGPLPNQFTNDRGDTEDSIILASEGNDIAVETIVLDILSENIPELEAYAAYKGDTPKTELGIIPLAVQCCILRLADIAQVSKILDTTDDHALLEMEEAENEAMQIGHPDYDFMLSPKTSAAIKILCDMIIDRAGSAKNFIAMCSSSDNFGGSFNVTEVSDIFAHPPLGTASIGGSHLGNISEPDYYIEPEPWFYGTDNDTPSSSGTGGSWLDKLFGALDKAGGAIGKLSDIIGSSGGKIKDTIGGIGGAVQDTASDIGAESIDKVLKKYIPYIIAVIAIIIIVLYVRRK